MPNKCGSIVTIPHSSNRWANRLYEVFSYPLKPYVTKLKMKYMIITFFEWEGHCAMKQSMRIGTSRFFSYPLKLCVTKLKMKYMIITLFKWEGHCAMKQSTRIGTSKSWSGLLPCISSVNCKRPHYCNGQWKLHHNNLRPHTAQYVWDLPTSHAVEVILHTPNGPWPCAL